MRRALVCGNWKLNGSIGKTGELVDALARAAAGVDSVDTAVCPGFVHVPLACERAAGTALSIGVQDASDQQQGAFTGEVSAAMAAEFGVRFAIVGHSERRARHGETDAGVAAKFIATRRAGVAPILCVGETMAERDAGETLTVIARQLDAVLDAAGDVGFGDGVIAYEPVWAIGTGRTATPEQAQEVHAALRTRLAARDQALAEGARIVYGGSMKGANAAELMAMPDIDGGLIGGASLDADEFMAIARAAAAA